MASFRGLYKKLLLTQQESLNLGSIFSTCAGMVYWSSPFPPISVFIHSGLSVPDRKDLPDILAKTAPPKNNPWISLYKKIFELRRIRNTQYLITVA